MTAALARAGTTPEAGVDEALGDPRETAAIVARDDAGERFPAELCARLDAFGMARYYVPVEHGGALHDHELMLRLWRTVARRDLSTAVAHGKTYLGAASVWIAAPEPQAAGFARAVLRGEPVAWALSEAEHGADLANGAVTATADAGGYRLDGRKWPINNATRARYVTLLARTGKPGTARGHSLFVVDKSTLDPGTWRALPKALTHGIRGIDISGLELTGAVVAGSALLGPEGTGLETVLRSLQLTRMMCSALSLGAGEHALRLAAAGSGPVVARCAALLAAAEAASLIGVRSVHGLTGELSVTSPVVKALVPALVDTVVGDLAEAFGERAYRAGEPFQRVARDHQIVSVFDGSTPVNRAALVQQFPRLARNLTTASDPTVDPTVDAGGLADAVAVGRPVRRLDRAALTLLSRRGCSPVQSLPALVVAVGSWGVPGLVRDARVVANAAADLAGRMAAVRPAARPPMLAYELAEAYELCFAAAACLHLWSGGAAEHGGEPLWRDGLWVRAALRALSARLAAVLRVPSPGPGDDDRWLEERMTAVVTGAVHGGGPVTPFGTAAP